MTTINTEFAAEMIGALSMQGKVAVVTGAASGLGKEAARLLSAAGAKVVLADINPAGLAQAADALSAGGAEVLARPTDVSSRDDMEALAEAAVRAFGGLDVWINSAGVVEWAGVTDMSEAQVAKVVGVNMLGTFWGVAAAGRVMRGQGRGGSIVNVSSLAATKAVPTLSVYGMTKAGVEQLTRIAAAEFGGDRVRVNGVAPGWIDTPINASMYSDTAGGVDAGKRSDVMRDMAALSPLGITGEAIDIAMALLYLASDASRFITGETLRVTGGA